MSHVSLFLLVGVTTLTKEAKLNHFNKIGNYIETTKIEGHIE